MNSKLYLGDKPEGRLYKWNYDRWIDVTPKDNSNVEIHSLEEYNGQLIGVQPCQHKKQTQT